MKTVMYYAVVGMRGADLGESVVALLSTADLAREVGQRFMRTRPGLVRCRVRRVQMLAASANGLAFASRIASSIVSTPRTITTGPKTPAIAFSGSRVLPRKTVGG